MKRCNAKDCLGIPLPNSLCYLTLFLCCIEKTAQGIRKGSIFNLPKKPNKNIYVHTSSLPLIVKQIITHVSSHIMDIIHTGYISIRGFFLLAIGLVELEGLLVLPLQMSLDVVGGIRRKKCIQSRSLHNFDHIWFRLVIICQLFSGHNLLHPSKQCHPCLTADSPLDHPAV